MRETYLGKERLWHSKYCGNKGAGKYRGIITRYYCIYIYIMWTHDAKYIMLQYGFQHTSEYKNFNLIEVMF